MYIPNVGTPSDIMPRQPSRGFGNCHADFRATGIPLTDAIVAGGKSTNAAPVCCTNGFAGSYQSQLPKNSKGIL